MGFPTLFHLQTRQALIDSALMVTSGATIRGRGKAKSSAPPFVPAGAPARRASKSPQRSRGGYPGVVRRSGSVRVTRDFPERRVIRVVDDPRGILSDSRYRPVGGTLNLHKNHQPHPHRPQDRGPIKWAMAMVDDNPEIIHRFHHEQVWCWSTA